MIDRRLRQLQNNHGLLADTKQCCHTSQNPMTRTVACCMSKPFQKKEDILALAKQNGHYENIYFRLSLCNALLTPPADRRVMLDFHCRRYHCWLSRRSCTEYSRRNPEACRDCEYSSEQENEPIYEESGFLLLGQLE